MTNKSLYIVSETRNHARVVPWLFPELEDSNYKIKLLGSWSVLGRTWNEGDSFLLHFAHIENERDTLRTIIQTLKRQKMHLKVLEVSSFRVVKD